MAGQCVYLPVAAPVLPPLPFAVDAGREPADPPCRARAGAVPRAPALPCRQAISSSSPCVGKGVAKSPGFNFIDFAVVLISKRGLELQLSGNESVAYLCLSI